MLLQWERCSAAALQRCSQICAIDAAVPPVIHGSGVTSCNIMAATQRRWANEEATGDIGVTVRW